VASNKPMVPTAHAAPAINPSRPLRRHIGQPLGGVNERNQEGRVCGFSERTTEGGPRWGGLRIRMPTAVEGS